jgi:hypothetical protein
MRSLTSSCSAGWQRQVGSAFFHLAFQFPVGLLQRLACRQLVAQAAAAFVQPQNAGEAQQVSTAASAARL